MLILNRKATGPSTPHIYTLRYTMPHLRILNDLDQQQMNQVPYWEAHIDFVPSDEHNLRS